MDYAADNESESDFMRTLKRVQSLVDGSKPQSFINPNWSAAISINYKRSDRPCGMFFGNEVATDERNESMEIEYNCHAEYSLPEFTSYAYIPAVEIRR